MLEDSLEILLRGGPVMAPILAVSIGAWVIIFARFFGIRRESHHLGEFLWRLESRLRGGGKKSALELCWETGVPIASMLAILFARESMNKRYRHKAVENAVRLERRRIGRGLGALIVLAGAATLLGLLGTVAGMVASFNVVTVHGTGEPSLLAKGISQALITTEAGLVVALPLLLVHSYLSSRVEAATVDAHRKLLDISALLGREGSR